MDLSQLIPGTTGRQSWAVVSSDTSVQANYGYLINASNNDVTLTLPSNPSLGTFVSYCDFYNKATTNVITISGNGKNIEGSSSDLIIDIDGAAGTLVYTDDTRGWTLSNNNGQNVQTTFNYQNYNDRGDEPSSPDFTEADLTTDGTYRDLDCSAFVPSNAVLIFFLIQIRDDAVGSTFVMRKNGNTSTSNANALRTQVANTYIDATFTVACDSNQVVDYYATNTTWSNINITILGWFTADDQVAVGSGNIYAPSDLSDNYLIRGDGGSKKVQTSTINITDNGEMTNSGQPHFEAYVNAQQSNVTGDGSIFSITGAFWTEDYDFGSNFSDGTFTAPISGRYLFTCDYYLTGFLGAHTQMSFRLKTTNNTYYPHQINPQGIVYGTGQLLGNFSILTYLNANDTAYLQIAISNGTKVVSVGATYTLLSGILIG